MIQGTKKAMLVCWAVLSYSLVLRQFAIHQLPCHLHTLATAFVVQFFPGYAVFSFGVVQDSSTV
jgi:hypothetical protein